jgi:hypothetical protein
MSVRSGGANFVTVVYQKLSNFGNPCGPFLEERLSSLFSRGLVDELVLYHPRTFSKEEKRNMVGSRCTGADLGGCPAEAVDDVFFNELTKREIGRLRCARAGCELFMSMDSDECYLPHQLLAAKALVLEKRLEGAACYMRVFFKSPTCELLPLDAMNAVPAIYRVRERMHFRLGCPYPVLLDPTRRLDNLRLFHVFPREQLEMFHYSFVRSDMKSKLANVSNRGNYQSVDDFLDRFERWREGDSIAGLHPHPHFRKLYTSTRAVANFFNIGVDQRCKRCLSPSGVASSSSPAGADAADALGVSELVSCATCSRRRR